jgi:hypothetical protein
MQIVSGPIGFERVHYQALDSTDLDQLMTAFLDLDWFNNSFSDDSSSTPDSQASFERVSLIYGLK